jgi:hypothetical protein
MRSISRLNVQCFIVKILFFRILFVPLMLLFIVKNTRNHICYSLLYNARHAEGPLDHKVTSTFNGTAYICVSIVTVDKLTKTNGYYLFYSISDC